jgi:hypothetical protein
MTVVGCEDDSTDEDLGITIDGWTWNVFTDKFDGGTSTITMKEVSAISPNGLNGLKFSGNVKASIPNGEWGPYGYANWRASPNNENLTALKNADGFSFKTIGDGKSYQVAVITSDVKDYSYHCFIFETPAQNTNAIAVVEVLYDDLEQPEFWGIRADFNKNNILKIEFTANTGWTDTGPFELSIWDLQAGFDD